MNRLILAGAALALSTGTHAETVAHWDFNDPSLGASNGAALPDSDGAVTWRLAATDKSGHGNHLTTWDWDWAGFNWSTNSVLGDYSIAAAGSYPAAMTWSAQSSPSGTDAETIAPAQWTVEAVFQCDDPTTFRTLVGRDGMQVVAGSDALAPFYLSERAGGVIAVQFADNAGVNHEAVSSGGRIVQDTWYHVAAVSDGSALSVYLKDIDADTPYQVVASADLTDSADSSMAVGSGSGADWRAGTWSIARGLYDGTHTDRFFGAVDAVAISTAALAPGSFVCYDAPPVEGPAPRFMENLDRGVVAVSKGGSQVYVGWRMLGTEPASVGYNVYRNATKLNASPITSSCNYVDTGGSLSATYRVAAVIGGVEQELSDPVNVWSSYYLGSGNYIGYRDVPLQRPAGGTTPDGVTYDYTPNDISVGDLDGDGQYEIVLKWDPSNSKDNSQSGYTGNVYLDAYELDGTFLWRIDLGINIRAGAHYTQFMVYDFDSDGFAEVICKTADGTTDGLGTVLGSPAADWRNGDGYILSGPEYLSAFDGRTGAFIDTVNYVPARGSVSAWGDSYGNRVDRFLACVAYLDGERPSAVMCRGYYTRSVLAAWDLVDGELVQRWVFDSNTPGNAAYAGQGNHNLSVADVDGDGMDEIVYGSCTIDHDGTGLYTTGLGHGDALHVSDMDPARPGLEVWAPHETAASGATYRDAASGTIIWEHLNAGDVGRGVAAHIDSRYPGCQLWSYATGGVYNTDGTKISDNYSAKMMGHLVWWTGDLQREFLGAADGAGKNPVLEKWGGDGSYRLISLYSVPASYVTQGINGTKANPCLSGDILGDWREEMIYHSSDKTSLRIFTTPYVTSHRIYTLMHDPQYRLAMAWQNVAYNQPPHPGFYIGEGMSPPPPPNIVLAGLAAPAAPDGLTAESGDAQVILSWNAVSNATAYAVKVGTASGGPYTPAANPATTGFTHAPLENGTPLYYVVSAINAGGEGPDSGELFTIPSVPVSADEFIIAGHAISGGTNISLGVTNAVPGHIYQMLATDSLMPPDWQPAADELLGAGTDLQFEVPIAEVSSNRYFKLDVQRR